jgi:hypothetical protein
LHSKATSSEIPLLSLHPNSPNSLTGSISFPSYFLEQYVSYLFRSCKNSAECFEYTLPIFPWWWLLLFLAVLGPHTC